MTLTYRKFLKQHISLAPLGIQPLSDPSPYFCTPKGAVSFGRAGTDGIHYCFIEGFDEMVFAVSPMNTQGNYVHPLAENFSDFLRLLLACKSADALEQAWQWDQTQFDAYIHDIVQDESLTDAMNAITYRMHLTPMRHPLQYLHTLQANFDYSRLVFAAAEPGSTAGIETAVSHTCFGTQTPAPAKCLAGEYPATPSPAESKKWRVYFNGNLNGNCYGDAKGTRAGKELPVHKKFFWDGEEWLIPSIYSCSKGLVVDFLRKIPAGQIQDFINRWHLSPDNILEDFDNDQQLLLELDNPFSFHPLTEATVNGKILPSSQSCGDCWNPVFCEFDQTQAQEVLRHYQLDPAFGWQIWRSFFPWKTARKPQMQTLSIRLSAQKQLIPGPHFHTRAPGDSITFTCPSTGMAHTLTVREYKNERLDIGASRLANPWKEYPTWYTVVGCTASPPLPQGSLSLVDCSDGDKPRELRQRAQTTSAESVSVIIGGADGPTALFLSGPDMLYAASAPHFTPPEEVEWRLAFQEQKRPDIRVELYPQKP